MSDFLKTIDERLARLGLDDWDEDDDLVGDGGFVEPAELKAASRRLSVGDLDDLDDDELDDEDISGAYDRGEHDPDRRHAGIPSGAYPGDVQPTVWTGEDQLDVGRSAATATDPLTDRRYRPDRFDSSELRETRRGTPRSHCDHGGDPASEMPEVDAPPGYLRSADGSWRYEHGGYVPGAVDDCIARRYGFARIKGGVVLVPHELLRQPDLEWVTLHADGESTQQTTHGTIRVAVVPRCCWDDHARVPLGIVAPELQANRMLDLSSIAHRSGTARSTINAYRSRGRRPKPQVIVAGTPLWSEAIVRRWILERA